MWVYFECEAKKTIRYTAYEINIVSHHRYCHTTHPAFLSKDFHQ